MIIEAEDELPKFVRSRFFILLACFVCATLAAVWFGVAHLVQSLRIEFARDQVEVFGWSLESALKAEPAKAVEHLEYVRHYYSSGSKQETGSKLDFIVETHRASVIREIIAHLRARTGVDLGNDPQAWIDRFGKP